MTLEIEIDNRRWTFDLSVDVKKLGVGGGCTLDFTVSSGPFLSDEIEIGDGPGPELGIIKINIDSARACVRRCDHFSEQHKIEIISCMSSLTLDS